MTVFDQKCSFTTKMAISAQKMELKSFFYFRPCDHRCVNLGGYYRCLCEEGFELEKDERTCKRVKSKCDLKESELNFGMNFHFGPNLARI